MKKTAVIFRVENGNESIGVIRDKVRVMLSNGSASFDNYVIEQPDGKINIVNPLNIVKRIPRLELSKKNSN